MSWKYLKYAYMCNMPEICLWYVWYILDILMRYVFDISVIYLRNAQDLHDLSLKISWDIPDTCLDIFEIYLIHARSLSLICIYMPDTFELCLKYIWIMSDLDMTDIFLTYVWDVGEICLKCALDLVDMLFKIWIKCQWVTDWVSEWVCDVMKARDAYASKNHAHIVDLSPG